MMGIRIIDDKAYIIYGPYQGGDKPEFTADPVVAMVSFDIFDDKVRHSKLYHPDYSKMACLNEESGEYDGWCVVTRDGRVGDHVENLYFMFPVKPDETPKSDMSDDVNHPKHYTGHKADVECIMFTELMPSLAANAFKYVWRCDDKGNKMEDLEKARWYLNRACQPGFFEHGPGRKLQHLAAGIIKGSDFDDWHKRVLTAIAKGYYVDAYNDISDFIGQMRYIPNGAEF